MARTGEQGRIIVFVLDTNHVSELTHRTRAGLRLRQRLDATNQDTAVSAIIIEESLHDWLAEIRRNTEPQTFSIE